MALRPDMLTAATRARTALGGDAEKAVAFLARAMNDDGAFRGRDAAGDLYFTVFGLSCMAALGAEFPNARVAEYLRRFGDGEELDFVHLTCLARCWAILGGAADGEAVLERIEQYRCGDGGYAQHADQPRGTTYACFLALGAYQDLGESIPDAGGLLQCIGALRSADGGFANHPDMPAAPTPVTAAAALLFRELGGDADESIGRWLLDRHCPDGGFLAAPAAPIPDLLSTATALHALAALSIDLGPIRPPCRAFVDSLWDPRGGFRGHWMDERIDCEYTFYGLLALGHLSD